MTAVPPLPPHLAAALEEAGPPLWEHGAYLLLTTLAARLNQEVADLLTKRGLTLPQYAALRAIRRLRGEDCTLSALGGSMVHRAPDLTRLVDRLEAHGWVERQPSRTDRRALRLTLTAAGADLLAALDGPIRAQHQRQFAHLTPEEGRTLMHALLSVLGNTASSPG